MQRLRKLLFWTVIIVDLWEHIYSEVTPVFPSQISTTAEEDLGKSVQFEGDIVKAWLYASSDLAILPALPTWDAVYINEVLSQLQLKHFFGSMRQAF